MPIQFRCSHCGQKLSISRKKAGSDVTCPECVQRTRVPTIEEAIAKAKQRKAEKDKLRAEQATKAKPAVAQPAPKKHRPELPSEAKAKSKAASSKPPVTKESPPQATEPPQQKLREDLPSEAKRKAQAELKEPAPAEPSQEAPALPPVGMPSPETPLQPPPKEDVVEEVVEEIEEVNGFEERTQEEANDKPTEFDDLFEDIVDEESASTPQAKESGSPESVTTSQPSVEEPDVEEPEEKLQQPEEAVADAKPGDAPKDDLAATQAWAHHPNPWLHEDEEDEDFQLASPALEESGLDMTPMVDVTFLLLIFFMVTASFSTQKSLETAPPEPDEEGAAAAVVMDDIEEESVVVEIDEEDNIRVDDVPVSGFGELKDVLQAKISNEGKTEMLIEANTQSRHGTVVAVTDAGLEVQMQRIRRTSKKGDD